MKSQRLRQITYLLDSITSLACGAIIILGIALGDYVLAVLLAIAAVFYLTASFQMAYKDGFNTSAEVARKIFMPFIEKSIKKAEKHLDETKKEMKKEEKVRKK